MPDSPDPSASSHRTPPQTPSPIPDEEKLSNLLAQAEVMFVGRSLEPEYRLMFDLDLGALKTSGTRILDVASGPASFSAELRDLGINVTAVDPMYVQPPEQLEKAALAQLQSFREGIPGNEFTDDWFDPQALDELNTPDKLLAIRRQGLELFLDDYANHFGRDDSRYIASALPELVGFDRQPFDLVLCGNFLVCYAGRPGLGYDFQEESMRALMGFLNTDNPESEVRVYPAGTDEAFNFPLQRLLAVLSSSGIEAQMTPSTHRFVKGWTHMLTLRFAESLLMPDRAI